MMKKFLLLCLSLLMLFSAASAEVGIPFYQGLPYEVCEDVWIEVPLAYEVSGLEASYPSAVVTDGMKFCMFACLPEGFQQSFAQVLRGEADVTGFQQEGVMLLAGEDDTGSSRVIERYVIDDLPAVRVDMVGQGFEMIWVGDAGDMYFFMYPTADETFAQDMRDVAATLFIADAKTAPRCDAADFTYTVEDDGVTITAYTGSHCRVKVPDTIEGKTVLRIAEQAFYETSVTWVELPDSITDIGSNAFSGCTFLQKLHLPAGLKAITYAMLESCFRLHELDVPEGVERIGSGAFWGNFYLERLSLPATLTEIEPFNFTMCNCLADFDLAEGNTSFKTLEDGAVLLSADGTQFISYRPWQERAAYTVPEGVTTIWPYAFNDMGSLRSVTVPESVTTIHGMAFHGSVPLKELHLTANVTELGSVPGEEGQVSVCSNAATIFAPEGSAAQAHAEQFKQSFQAENPAETNTDHPNIE